MSDLHGERFTFSPNIVVSYRDDVMGTPRSGGGRRWVLKEVVTEILERGLSVVPSVAKPRETVRRGGRFSSTTGTLGAQGGGLLPLAV